MLSPTLRKFLKDSGKIAYAEKIFIHVHYSSDLTLYIINAHLVIEELVFNLILKSLKEPNAIGSQDFNYQKKCLLLKALYGAEFPEWLYSGLVYLGALRNKCAHVLDHPKLDAAIAAIVRTAYDNSEENEKLLLKTKGKRYILPLNTSEKNLQAFEETAQRQHNSGFRLPMACERIIEYLLRTLLTNGSSRPLI